VIVKVHISHLRQKLEAGVAGKYVETIRGVGYLLERRETGNGDDGAGWDASAEAEPRSGTA
jgi:DNA-binding winged helix-turn-helix (wHTH) protein